MSDPLEHPPHRVHDHLRTRAIVVHAGRLLLIPPSAGDRAWLPPGGGLEPGEGLAECLAREVLEETGIRIRVGRLAFLQEWVALPGRDELRHALLWMARALRPKRVGQPSGCPTRVLGAPCVTVALPSVLRS